MVGNALQSSLEIALRRQRVGLALHDLRHHPRRHQVGLVELRHGGLVVGDGFLHRLVERTEPETSQPEPEADEEPEQRSNAELIDAILDMLGDTELTSDNIIDNCRFFAEILQQRFPLPQDTRLVATLMHELQKAEG
jgi:hypothetical protein